MPPAWARASFRASGFCIPHQDPYFPRPREIKYLAQEHTATDQAFSPLDPALRMVLSLGTSTQLCRSPACGLREVTKPLCAQAASSVKGS